MAKFGPLQQPRVYDPNRPQAGGTVNRTALTIVAEIRRKHAEGTSQASLAREHKLSLNTVHKMVTGLTYRHVAQVKLELTEQQLQAQSNESARKMLLDLGMPIPDYLKTEAEVETERRDQRIAHEVNALIAEKNKPTGPERELQPDEIWDESQGRIRKRTPYDPTE